ncbi:Uncharacterised protein [Legionella lansingensis]|uniref:Uncharacterized protein n=1 Tax=Legionella lansingensis TaxID=45067 RepID=A0A0W0VPH8_9GAMM|nr:hypothetical protein [Legionella lansingensis]KTD22080.1 hypothetical protein Llan_1343 [Legionella lansingensis]SNV45963.1 Uncharacterised protein [Legionella lansingensis]
MDAKRFAINLLVNDAYRTKVLIKYDIKLLENRLQKAMGDGKNARLRTQEAAHLCLELALKYEDLLHFITLDYQEPGTSISCYENNPSRCYVVIQTLKGELNLSTSLYEEIRIIQQLRYYYKYLQEQLNGMQPQSLEFTQRVLTGRLKTIIASDSCSTWLPALVAFANDAGENPLSCISLVAQLQEKEILQLAALFEQPNIILLINSIFFYKLYPDQLFKQVMHPEKLISVKTRLLMLHQFIERLHQAVTQTLKQRGIGEIHDYLFHEDELPQGIMIHADNNANLIITALKEWRLSNINASDDFMIRNKLNDLFRAYKFWFNPNRLIDTVMTLQQLLVGDMRENYENYKKFSLDMQALFHQLSTTECLDLYGYFANKDSSYLMRTLIAILEDQQISALAPPNQQQKEAIARVYKILDCVMEAIREELFNRHITTAPYSRHSGHKPLMPGRRNLNAITRIMNVYGNSATFENKTIDALFKEIGI